ncbi:transcriptional regulator [Hapalosiphon sp. MRB220]|nr:transcriptional regulator [Hapalosiphon sp. MRB220]
MEQFEFDVFLAHNSKDKPQVRAIAEQLTRYNLKPWFDEEEIIPGDNIQQVVFQGISQSKVGAFFISQNGLGTFQENLELGAIIQFFLKKHKNQGFRVIPILLGINDIPDSLFYLSQWAWIQFTSSNDEAALKSLIRGIRGRGAEVQAPPVIQIPDTPLIIEPKPPQTDDLASEKGIDYTRLRDLLKAGKWKEADKETYQVMIQVVGKKDGDWFTSDELLNFPCTDLHTIDQLWVKYSHGHFGFSVQKKIYLSVGGKADGKYYQAAWEKFGDRVGWRVKSKWIYYINVTFDTLAPKGHLPVIWWGGWFSGKVWVLDMGLFNGWVVGGSGRISSLASRLVKCKI